MEYAEWFIKGLKGSEVSWKSQKQTFSSEFSTLKLSSNYNIRIVGHSRKMSQVTFHGQ